MRMLRNLLFCAALVSVAVPAYAEGIRCWLRCHDPKPPNLNTAEDVVHNLRKCANPELNWIARSTGFLTTYLFKYAGIQGWRDLHHRALTRGEVMHAAGSDDGLYTIDLRIADLSIDGQPVVVPPGRYIRVEVFPHVRFPHRPIQPKTPICLEGKLMWDGDGFLEIHPDHSGAPVSGC